MKDFDFEDIITGGLGCSVIAFGTIVFVILMLFLRAFIILYLWKWFVTPFGLPELGYAHAYGLGVLSSYLTSHLKREGNVGVNLLSELCCLGVGYLCHLMMG